MSANDIVGRLQATLQNKSAQSAPAAPAAQAAPAVPADDNSDNGSSAETDASAASSVNLARAYSVLNERIIELCDNLGVRRTATIPHIKGQSMAEHIQGVNQILHQSGGLTGNIVAATHSDYGPDGGVTTAHPAEKLRTTVVPKNFEPAKKAIDACKSLINKAASILPEKELHRDDAPMKVIDTAKDQLALLAKADGAGMTGLDLAIALIGIPHQTLKVVARLNSSRRHGDHHASLTVPTSSEQQQPSEQ